MESGARTNGLVVKNFAIMAINMATIQMLNAYFAQGSLFMIKADLTYQSYVAK